MSYATRSWYSARTLSWRISQNSCGNHLSAALKINSGSNSYLHVQNSVVLTRSASGYSAKCGYFSNNVSKIGRGTSLNSSDVVLKSSWSPFHLCRSGIRSYSTGSGRNSNQGGSNMLFIGLGAMGLALFSGFYSGEFYRDHGASKAKSKEPLKTMKDLPADVKKELAEKEEALERELEEKEEAMEKEIEEMETQIEKNEEALDAEIEKAEQELELAKEKMDAVIEQEIQKTEDIMEGEIAKALGSTEVTPTTEEQKDPPQSEEKDQTTTSDEKEQPTTSEEKEQPTTTVVEEPGRATDTTVEKTVPQLPFPEHVPYVVIGAGTASHAACRAIKKRDPYAKVLIIGQEEVLPYMRPPLSKELWFSDDPAVGDTLHFQQWNGKQRSVFFEKESYFVQPQELSANEKGGIAVLTGHRVVSIDPDEHNIKLKNGTQIKYDKLLLATGGKPKNMDIFESTSDDVKLKTTLFRTVADFRKLDKISRSVESIAVIGGGFLGSELACALAHRGKNSSLKVLQIFPEKGNMAKVLPQYLSSWTTEKVKSEGVNVISDKQIKGIEYVDGKVSLSLNDDQKVEADHVVVCVGLDANVELAQSAGLEVDPELGGFRVNSELEARSDIWVAGDAACFYDSKLGRRRIEHHDHAVVSGRLAGENMTGAKRSYWHQSMFWSDLGPDVGYEAIGIVDSTLPTVGVWAKATEKDTPKAVVEATGEGLRSETEEQAGLEEQVVTEELVKEVEPENTTRTQASQYGKGVVFYLKGKTVVGILLWNVFNRMPVARQIIKEGKEHENLQELAKLFDLYKE